MSETDLVSSETAAAPAPRKRGGLTGMVLAELRQLAAELNIPGTAGMRKGDLIAAIRTSQAGGDSAAAAQLPLPGGPEAVPVDTPVAEAPAKPARASRSRNGAAPAAPAVSDTPAAPPGAEAAETAAEVAKDDAAGAQAEAPAPATGTRRRRSVSRPAGAPSRRAAEPPAEAAAQPAAEAAPEVAPEATPAVAPEAIPSAPAAGPDVAAAAAEASTSGAPATNGSAHVDAPAAAAEAPPAPSAEASAAPAEAPPRRSRQTRRNRAEQAEAAAPAEAAPATEDAGDERPQRGRDRNGRAVNRGEDARTDRADNRGDNRGGGNRNDNRGDNRGDNRTDNRADNRGDNRADNRAENRGDTRTDNRGPRDNRPESDDDDFEGRGRRGRRFRDRRRGRERETGGRTGQGNVDTEVRDGDVLLPVAGIVEKLDNYAFVRTTGYLSSQTDCYISQSVVNRYGLRRGDAITGAAREQREGEQTRQKFDPLVRVDSINGQDPETARNRPEFTKLTPLYPNERLRLETEPHKLTTRVIDLVMPIGKGQRALIVSPPKAGKTTIMQNIANAISTNNPECHLMVVLVDERPEEVTDMQRSVKGEVIASTFDRPPTDHTTIAELAIERAKRLVELGHDVVVLLDNITRLGRAYNLAAPASGRILSGGVDSTALYPPKRFLGAARNIEGGGSLTIFATALVETGSTMDTVIFEEFKGTGNAELKLDRKIADKRVFPAIDVGDSSTRKDELLMSPDEYSVMVKLRRVLSALDDQQAIDLLLTQLRKTRTNIEFLMQVAKSTPGNDD
ncbi:transcription termination factor Rho [Pseudonocardia humida]|uniref:Transcription termination factor Rho n=1 Tax=Pseudonocardia humida TaxID=2800819 RepID=A0ABT1A5N2_9PSEU|nr:transcription termination factor Rho [Pseudonocardia humida]MCO1658139.1 transcription termination factor Rho [Pseudonocardia humida]